MVVERQLLLDSSVKKETLRLDGAVLGKFARFQAKFCGGHDVDLERLRSSKYKVYSARVDRSYRAILLHLDAETYALLSIMPHDEAYDRIDERLSVRIRARSGGLEIHDQQNVTTEVGRSRDKRQRQANETGLFDWVSDEDFTALDLEGLVLSSIRMVRDKDDLDGLLKHADSYVTDVLRSLEAGMSVQDVLEAVTEPETAQESVDTEDFIRALRRPTSVVTTSDVAVEEMLNAGPAAWRLFLHPAQNRLAHSNFDGPARVSGGPGTGKTVVALHRTAALAAKLADDDRILLTTFNVTLASELQDKLARILDPELLDRVEVTNIDKIAWEQMRLSGINRQLCASEAVRPLWEQVVSEYRETEFDAEFLLSEWSEVICQQLLTTREEYFAARRVGRMRRVGRAQRARIWELTTRFWELQNGSNLWTWDQMRMAAALRVEAEAKPPYRHIIVDEAQDMTLAHWRMLRALVPRQPNDVFIVGDTFQRLYGVPVALSSAGIHIRGRASRLTLSYRTSQQHLTAAKRLLADATMDDLDEGVDSLSHCRSVLSGDEPQMLNVDDTEAERKSAVEQVQQWVAAGTPPESIAVCAPLKSQLSKLTRALRDAGMAAEQVENQVPSGPVVHVSTMHRLKGMEYRCVVITGVGEEFPPPWVTDLAASDMRRYKQAVMSARSLLFVAFTRARDSLTVIWSGQPSPLLHEVTPAKTC